MNLSVLSEGRKEACETKINTIIALKGEMCTDGKNFPGMAAA